MAGQLPVSDVTPGVPAPRTLDWDSVTRQLNSFEARLDLLRPLVVKRRDGLYRLSQLNVPLAFAASAQLIVDHCEARFPEGTKIQWIIISEPRPGPLTAADVT